MFGPNPDPVKGSRLDYDKKQGMSISFFYTLSKGECIS